MYLHIGKSVMIPIHSIIGIFDIEAIQQKESKSNLLENIEKQNVIDVSEGAKKSIIMLQEKDIIVIYISNISSVTLAKRAQNNFFE